jgi:hypothetical protein
VRERIEYRFRVPSTTVFTIYLYSKTLEYRLEYASAGSHPWTGRPKYPEVPVQQQQPMSLLHGPDYYTTGWPKAEGTTTIFSRLSLFFFRRRRCRRRCC